ncbi:hypothetical protein KEM52_005454 [Ascosphaera acerosa]|nr:hypothetical protein KEM52_005454 [Ascosphaera acerosa]
MQRLHCQRLASPSPTNFAISLLILAGVVGSYIPQHHRLITRKTSFGISPYFLLLGATSAVAGLANILLLPASQRDIECCSEIGAFACFASLLGVLQVGAGFVCFALNVVLYVIYTPRRGIGRLTAGSGSQLDDAPSQARAWQAEGQGQGQDSPAFRLAVGVASLCLLDLLVTVLVSLLVEVWLPQFLQLLANAFGITAALLASVQYLPQIYTTYRLRGVGSLSIPTMCIQTPGSFVWAASLAARVGWEGWSTWGIYIVTATVQGTLLAMGVYFQYVEPRAARKPSIVVVDREEDEIGTVVVGDTDAGGASRVGSCDETTPLLLGEGNFVGEPTLSVGEDRR